MKKIFTIALFAVSLSANAFWGNNNGPWSNGYNNNNYGYQQDNGIFGSDDCSYVCKGLIVTYSCFLKATLKTKRVISKSYLWV
jgi:hypothetical protein